MVWAKPIPIQELLLLPVEREPIFPFCGHVRDGLGAIAPGYGTDMPGFGPKLDDREIMAILDYIKQTWPDRERDVQQSR